MKKFSLSDLWLILDNMVRLRLVAISLLVMGASYVEEVRALHARIGSLPGVQNQPRPLADELADEDFDHDLYGRAMHFFLYAYELLEPKLPDEINANVALIRKNTIASPDELTLGYIDEAKAAMRRRPKLASIGPALASLPVAGLGTFEDLANLHTTHGVRLDELLNKRAETRTLEEIQTNELRYATLGLFSDIRDAARLQLRSDNRRRPSEGGLPTNIESQIFGYADALLQLRNSGNATETPIEDIQVPTPTPEPTPV